MPSINKQPFGFLGFLGIKNFGRNPSAVAEILAPTWDLSDLYLQTNSVWNGATIAVAAAGVTSFVTVPAGEVWVIHEAGWYTPNIMPAASSISATLASANSIANVFVPLCDTTRIVTGFFGSGWTNHIILSAGEQLSLFCQELVGGPHQVRVTYRYTQLQV
jgi:hypothetical protein